MKGFAEGLALCWPLQQQQLEELTMKSFKNCWPIFCALAVLIMHADPLPAEPVTLAFEAEIASVQPFGGGVELPFNVEIGDPLTGRFALQPQKASFRVRTPDFLLQTSGYHIAVENNQPGFIPLRGRIADPPNTPAVDRFVGPNDVIDLFHLGCMSGPCKPAVIPGEPILSWTPRISLINDSDLLNSDEIISDPRVLNAFSFREMSLTFYEPDTGKAVIIGAFVGEITAIPEPSSASITVVCICLAVGLWRTASLKRDRDTYAPLEL